MAMSRHSRPSLTRAGLALSLAITIGLSACAVPVRHTVRTVEPPPAPVAAAPLPPPPPREIRYGTVTRIEAIDTQVGVSGGGAVAGAVVGGVVGNQIGGGAGRAAATMLGIFGGAVAGDAIERANAANASRTVYRVYVRFDDGGRRHFDYSGLDGLRTGERVRLEGGVLQRG